MSTKFNHAIHIRCSEELNQANTRQGDHIAIDIRLPLPLDQVVQLGRLMPSMCMCGAEMVIKAEDPSDTVSKNEAHR